MEVSSGTHLKIVWKDDTLTKSAKGHVLEDAENYIVLDSEYSGKLWINKNSIVFMKWLDPGGK